MQDEVFAFHLVRLFRADADADAAIIFANMLSDRFDAVMAGDAATFAQADLAKIDVELIVYDDDMSG